MFRTLFYPNETTKRNEKTMTTKTTKNVEVNNNDENVNVSRETTRAIRTIDFDKTKNMNVPDTFTRATFVRMSSGNIRIDHTNCTHATSGNDGKRDRAKCRAIIERTLRERENAKK